MNDIESRKAGQEGRRNAASHAVEAHTAAGKAEAAMRRHFASESSRQRRHEAETRGEG